MFENILKMDILITSFNGFALNDVLSFKNCVIHNTYRFYMKILRIQGQNILTIKHLKILYF